MKKLLILLCVYSLFITAKNAQVVIPMAGLGTRLLPSTKSIPKCMIPLLDRPALQHTVEEALQSDFTDFCFVVNEQDQPIISEYFSPGHHLDAILQATNKSHFVCNLNDIIARAIFTYIPQSQPLGSGHAVLQAEKYITPGSFFGVMYPDDKLETTEPHMARLMQIAKEYNATVISVQEMTRAQASIYGVVMPSVYLANDLVEVADIIEKQPSTEDSLCLVSMGRYVFSYDIFESLRAIEPAANGEYQLTDAIQHMIKSGKRVLAYTIKGTWYDIGNIPGLLKTTVALGLHNPLYQDMVRDIFQKETEKISQEPAKH